MFGLQFFFYRETLFLLILLVLQLREQTFGHYTEILVIKYLVKNNTKIF